MGRFLVIAGILAALAVVGAACFVAGAVIGQLQLYRSYTDAKLEKIAPVLRDRRFAGVRAESSSAAQVYLVGSVGSSGAYKSLEERMRFLFGDEEARFMMSNVEVAGEPTETTPDRVSGARARDASM